MQNDSSYNDVTDSDSCDACLGLSQDLPDWVLVERSGLAATFITDRQRSPASVLVLPIRHVPTLMSLSRDEVKALSSHIRRVGAAIIALFDPAGLHVWTSVGPEAGQSMDHMHFQLAPRYEGQEYSFAPSHELLVTPLAEREKQAEMLISWLAIANPDTVGSSTAPLSGNSA